MPQPRALMARMNRNIAASRPHSRADTSVRAGRKTDKVNDLPFVRGLVSSQGSPGDRTYPLPGQSPLRDSAGISPASLGCLPPGHAARAVGKLHSRLVAVKLDWMISH